MAQDLYNSPYVPESVKDKIKKELWQSGGKRAWEDKNLYTTKLTKAEEEDYQDWKEKYAASQSDVDYDYRGAFKAGLKPNSRGHLSDKFKKPNHPTFSDESIYSTKETPGGHWGRANGKDTFTPSDWMESDPKRIEYLPGYFREQEPDVQLILKRTSPVQNVPASAVDRTPQEDADSFVGGMPKIELGSGQPVGGNGQYGAQKNSFQRWSDGSSPNPQEAQREAMGGDSVETATFAAPSLTAPLSPAYANGGNGIREVKGSAWVHPELRQWDQANQAAWEEQKKSPGFTGAFIPTDQWNASKQQEQNGGSSSGQPQVSSSPSISASTYAGRQAIAQQYNMTGNEYLKAFRRINARPKNAGTDTSRLP